MFETDPLILLVDESRVGHTGEGRERQRVLGRMAEEGASLAGALVDLAERRSAVTVRTTSGRSHHGVVVAVGSDFAIVRCDRGSDVIVRTDAIVTVRPHAPVRHHAATGDRPPPLDLRLAEVLARLAGDRPRVVASMLGGEVAKGELVAVGSDVATVRPDGGGTAVVYVAIGALVEVAVEW